jgi:hypothetical protein
MIPAQWTSSKHSPLTVAYHYPCSKNDNRPSSANCNGQMKISLSHAIHNYLLNYESKFTHFTRVLRRRRWRWLSHSPRATSYHENLSLATQRVATALLQGVLVSLRVQA